MEQLREFGGDIPGRDYEYTHVHGRERSSYV
jgi:hypothetical protein